MNVIMERHQYRVFTTGEEIREFSVNYAKLSGKCLVAYDCLLFKHGASFKYSPVTSHRFLLLLEFLVKTLQYRISVVVPHTSFCGENSG